MDAIPTPRSDAAELDNAHFHDEGYGPSNYVSKDDMQQLERELHIAKQALEKIVQERFYPMSKRLATAEGLAENALQEIKNLTK